jgi:hypothetical protein
MNIRRQIFVITAIAAEALICSLIFGYLTNGDHFVEDFLYVLVLLSPSFIAMAFKKNISSHLSGIMLLIVFLFFLFQYTLTYKSGGSSMIMIPLILFGLIFSIVGAAVGLLIDGSKYKEK